MTDKSKFPRLAIVTLQGGGIKGLIVNVMASDGVTEYFVAWDDGNSTYHSEKELQWATPAHPVMHDKKGL